MCCVMRLLRRRDIRFANGVEQTRFGRDRRGHHVHPAAAASTLLGLFFRNFSTISSSRETTFTHALNDSASVVAVGTSSAWLCWRKHPGRAVLQEFLGAHIQLFGKFAIVSFGDRPSRGGRGSAAR